MLVAHPTIKGMLITHDYLHHLKPLGIPAPFHHDLILVLTGATGCKEVGVPHVLILHEVVDIPHHRLIGRYLLPFRHPGFQVYVGNGCQLLIEHLTGALVPGKVLIEPYVLDDLLDLRLDAWEASGLLRFPAQAENLEELIPCPVLLLKLVRPCGCLKVCLGVSVQSPLTLPKVLLCELFSVLCPVPFVILKELPDHVPKLHSLVVSLLVVFNVPVNVHVHIPWHLRLLLCRLLPFRNFFREGFQLFPFLPCVPCLFG